MAVWLRSYSTYAYTSAPGNTTFPVPSPASYVAGDVFVLLAQASGSELFPPSGWTQQAVTNASGWAYVYTKIATASEPSTYSFDTDGGLSYSQFVLLCLGGVSSSSQIGGAAISYASVSGTTITAPSFTSTITGSALWMMMTGIDLVGSTFTAPSGYSSGYVDLDASGTYPVVYATALKSGISSGSIASADGTVSSSLGSTPIFAAQIGIAEGAVDPLPVLFDSAIFDSVIFDVGPSGTAVALAAAVTAVSTATSALTVTAGGVAQALAASVSAVSTSTGALTQGVPLAASASALSASTGALTHGVPLAASASALATSTGVLSLTVPLAASASALSTSTAALTVSVGAALAATASAVSTSSGTLLLLVPLAASAAAVSTSTGAITHGVPLAAAAASVASTTGALTVVVGASLAATASAVSTATGALTHDVPLAASAAAVATPTAVLAHGVPLAATVAALAASTGAITHGTPLAAFVSAVSTASGSLASSAITLAAAAQSVSTATGSVNSTPTPQVISLTAVKKAATGATVVPLYVVSRNIFTQNVLADLDLTGLSASVTVQAVYASASLHYPKSGVSVQTVSAA